LLLLPPTTVTGRNRLNSIPSLTSILHRGKRAVFHRACRPTGDELNRLLDSLSRRIVRVLECRGLLIADPERPSLDWVPDCSLDHLQGATVSYRIAIGPQAGRKALPLYSVPPLDEAPNHSLLARLAGFSLHAATVCEAPQRNRLERLCRYIQPHQRAGGQPGGRFPRQRRSIRAGRYRAEPVLFAQGGPGQRLDLGRGPRIPAADFDRNDISDTFLQPFVTYTAPTALSFAIQAEATYDWKAEQWNVPVGFFVSKVVRLGQQMISIQAGPRYFVESTANGPEGRAFRVNLTLLFPR
jgi:hypothetical protein